MKERRNIRRIDSFITASINNECCYITDITYEGASLFFNSKKDIKKGDSVEIRVDLSNLTYIFKKEVITKANVVWVKFENEKTFIGVSFIEENKENKENKENIDLIVNNWDSIKP